MTPSESVHPCPNCGEAVFGSAQQCRHCGRSFAVQPEVRSRPTAMPFEPMPSSMKPTLLRATPMGVWPDRGHIHGRRLWLAMVLSLILPGLGHLYMGYKPQKLWLWVLGAIVVGYVIPPPFNIIARIVAIVSLKKRHGRPRRHRRDRFDSFDGERMPWGSVVTPQMRPIHIHVHTDRG